MLRIYNHLNHVRVRGKSLILIGLMAISFLVVITIVGHHITNLEQARTQKQHLDQISNLINQLAFNTFELHLSMAKVLGNDKNSIKQILQFDTFVQEKIATIKKNIANLKTELSRSNQITEIHATTKPMESFDPLLEKLLQNHQSVLTLKKQLGYNENDGLMRELRTHIHALEFDLTKKNNDQALVKLLQLRRREKDYIMRGHPESLKLFQEAILTLWTTIDALSATNNPGSIQAKQIMLHYQQKAEQLQQSLPLLNTHLTELLQINNTILATAKILMNQNQGMINAQANAQEQTLLTTSFNLILSLAIAYLLLGGITYLFFHSILTPIQLLSQYANQISTGQYDLKIALHGTNEIGELAQSLQTMKDSMLGQQKFLEEQVKRRTEHLEITNMVLNDTINELNATHLELLQSEKMASLGRLVAGFAHEINTPIGITITTISNIPELIRQLHLMLKQDEIDEEELEDLLNQLKQSAELGLSSINKAANLVSRFKRTSADQSSEESRTFNIYEVIQDILSTLNTTFKKTQIEITLLCPTQINIHSQPGLIAQILTNLLMNSFKHGFDNGTQAGHITLNIQYNAAAKLLHTRYTDNGAGIPSKHLNTIFEPFYTTARDKGGTGLGLTICYNIVTTQLRGEITCQSEVGKGVVFDIRIPTAIIS